MRVALHTPFVVHKHTGIARYIFGLLDALAAADGDTEYVCFWPPEAPWPAHLPANFTREPYTIGEQHPAVRILGEQRWMEQVYRTKPFDVLHSPFGYLPPRIICPSVLTVPDLRAFRHPKTFGHLRGAFLRRAIPRSVELADRTLAMSEATRDEILALVPRADPDRVRVSYPGLDARWSAPVPFPDLAAVRERHDLPARFVLAVGTHEGHKNLPRLLIALSRLRETPGFADLHLVLAGATIARGKSDDLGTVIDNLGLGAVTRPLGVVPDEDLPAVYRAATVLAFPSLYEGFGYPPLEAMAVGTPVVTSGASCLPEIADDAAEIVDPLDPASIADGLRRVLSDPARREELVRRGRERAAQFSWDRHAREVIAAYREVGG